MLSYVVSAIYWLINLICILIVIEALLSWLPLSQDNKLNSFLSMMTEPVVAPIRKLLYKVEFLRELPVDFSPLVAIFILIFISRLLVLL